MATRTSAGQGPPPHVGSGPHLRLPRRRTLVPRVRPSAAPAQRRPASASPRVAAKGPGRVVRPRAQRIGRLFAALWLGVAHLLGGGVRRARARRAGERARARSGAPSRRARPRLLIGAAIVTAAGVWWQLDGRVGSIGAASSRAASAGSRCSRRCCCSPPPYVSCATRPGPARPAAPSSAGSPAARRHRHDPRRGTARRSPPTARRRCATAGGWLGYLALGAPDLRCTAFVALPAAGLLAGFGVLVLTGTPVHQVPDPASRAVLRPPAAPPARPVTPDVIEPDRAGALDAAVDDPWWSRGEDGREAVRQPARRRQGAGPGRPGRHSREPGGEGRPRRRQRSKPTEPIPARVGAARHCRGDVTYHLPAPELLGAGARTRRGPRPTTRSSSPSPRCWTSSTSTPR